MFEAKLLNGNILKKIVEAIKDVVNDVNIDVSPSGKQPSCRDPLFAQAFPSKPWTAPTWRSCR